MSNQSKLLKTIQNAPEGLTLSDLLSQHPTLARRTVQRWVQSLIESQQVVATGKARSRRYFAATIYENEHNNNGRDAFPKFIPLSADSKDILTYVDQPQEARKPVSYQREFLLNYQPNKTYYLSKPLREQLRKMGNTQQRQAPAGTYSRTILNRLLIDLSWASSHLEGNTYSRLDTRHLIEQGKIAEGKEAIETQMILNHKSAIELIVENADTAQFDLYTLLNLHSALSENLLPNPADEGRVRQHEVQIAKSVLRPLSIPAQISELLNVALNKANEIKDPFEQSFFMMVHLPYLQAFVDINKRTSRMAANIPLIRTNLCPLTFLDVPEQAYTRAILGVYELTRIELLRDLYVWAYERSTQEYIAIKRDLVEPDPVRLKHREFIRSMIYSVVTQPDNNPLNVITNKLAQYDCQESELNQIEALVIDELRRLHEGVLARYGLKPSELKTWLAKQSGI